MYFIGFIYYNVNPYCYAILATCIYYIYNHILMFKWEYDVTIQYHGVSRVNTTMSI